MFWHILNLVTSVGNLVNLGLVTFLVYFYPNVPLLQATAIAAWIMTITGVVSAKKLVKKK